MLEEWFDPNEFEDFVREVEELQERVVSLQTRRKMARIARKTAKKRARVRKRKEKFRKTPAQIKTKAEKQAKGFLRKKMLGGAKWSDLSITARAQIDKRLEKKSATVKKIAKKLLPKVKVAERERIQKLRQKTPGQPSGSVKEERKPRATFKGTAVAKAKERTEKEVSQIKSRISQVQQKIDAEKSLGKIKTQKSAAKRKREDAERKIEQSRKRIAALRSRLKKEEHGAGDEGTGELLQTYMRMTPGEKNGISRKKKNKKK